MGFKGLSLRTKMILIFTAAGTLPMIVSVIVSYTKTYKEYDSLAQEKAKTIANNKVIKIHSYFEAETNAIVDLASSEVVVTALEQFSRLPKEWVSGATHDKHLQAAQKFYSNDFGGMYFEKNKSKLAVDGIVEKLDKLTLAAQYDFIFTNENPLGSKDKLTTPLRDTVFSQTHERFHNYFRDYQIRHSLYDLFLVNLEGRIVYSVFKETDFYTSLKHGPWAESSLAKAFANSLKVEAGQVHIEDFALYTPSYDAPASFAGTPIYKDGQLIGSLLIQLPLDKITAIAGIRDGLGELGEVLLLGSDHKLRADTFRNKDTHSVALSFAKDSKVSTKSEAVDLAVSGKTGFIHNTSYDGLATIAYYLPVEIRNLKWFVVVELPEKEVYAGLNSILFWMIAVLIMGLCSTILAVILFGGSIARTLTRVIDILRNTSKELLSASINSKSLSSELTESTSSQASSLQETMASAEEISAMVAQNADSAAKAKEVVDVNQKSTTEGSSSVNDMTSSIEEIKKTNDKILEQMETSNREFSDIVKIITEIGEKTKVINDIVFQTKLLSFNASVEAARAGEHGKGFAVVAEEVGNLAQMSGNAAKQITDMLSNSIGKVNEIVASTTAKVDQLVEVGKDKISMGQMTAQKCRKALEVISQNASTVAGMINEITHASKEQAMGVQEINKAIGLLDGVTQQNASVAQQSSKQSEQLTHEAQMLSEAVNALVMYVHGESAAHKETNVANNQPQAPQNRALPLRKTQVTKLMPKEHKITKQAAGAEYVPSSNDSQFEEF